MVSRTILHKARGGNRKPIVISSRPTPSKMADDLENLRLASDSPERPGSLDSTKNSAETQMQTGNSASSGDSLGQSSLIYHCIFHVLPCEHAFNNVEDWKAHVLGHFQGHALPLDVRCAWCGRSFDSTSVVVVSPSGSDFDDDDIGSEPLSPRTTRRSENDNTTLAGTIASTTSSNTEFLQVWHTMLNHIADSHLNPSVGDTDNEKDPFPGNNYCLMQYLYWSKSISEDQFKAAVQLVPAVSPSTTTTMSPPSSSPLSPSSPIYRRWSRRYSSQQQDELLRASVGSSDEPFVAGYSPRRERKLREQRQQQQQQLF